MRGRGRTGVLRFPLSDGVAATVYGLDPFDDGPAPPDPALVAEEIGFDDGPRHVVGRTR